MRMKKVEIQEIDIYKVDTECEQQLNARSIKDGGQPMMQA